MKPTTLVRKLLNTALAPLNLEIQRKAGPQMNMQTRLENAKRIGLNPRTVIDVGVATGTHDLYAAFPDARYLLVEPLEEYRADLERIVAALKHAQYILAAATHTPGEVTINVHPYTDGSSLYLEDEDSDVNGVPRIVPAVMIDAVCDEMGLAGPYLLKIDVQGAELDVLRGAEHTLQQTDFVILEASFFEFFQNGPQLYDILAFMKTHGFVAYDIFEYQYRLLDGAMSQVDMAFVPENSIFRRDHAYATPTQRAQQHRASQAKSRKPR